MALLLRLRQISTIPSNRLAAMQLQQQATSCSSVLSSLWGGEPTTAGEEPTRMSRVKTLIPSLSDLAWFAAPKRKVTPHRKGNRSATKHIRFVPVVARCSKCERVFQQHQMPSKCEMDDCPAFNLRARPQTPSS